MHTPMPLARLLRMFVTAAAMITRRVAADVDTYPVKSVNLAAASQVVWYRAFPTWQSDVFGDLGEAHAVYVVTAADGGAVLGGAAYAREGSEERDAWAMKVSAAGAFVWGWRSRAAGHDMVTALAQLPGNDGDGDVLAVGFRQVGEVVAACVTRLSGADGREVWSVTLHDASNGAHSAVESVAALADGGVALAGVKGVPTSALEELAFRSGGNVVAGTAVVYRFPATAVEAPDGAGFAAAAASWAYEDARFISCKAVRETPAGELALLLFAEADWPRKIASVAMLLASGEVAWGPNDYAEAHGEGTDLAVSLDGSAVVIAGHGGAPGGALSARVTAVAAATGVREWTAEASAADPARPALIFNECWGVAATGDGGFALACGTGIEECAPFSGEDRANCRAGRGDSRVGAVPRPAGVWQSLVLKVSRQGSVQWQRVDSYRHPGEPALGTPGWDAGSGSAAEYLATTADGGLVVVMDDPGAGGVAVLKLDASGCTTAASSVSSLPLPPPPPPAASAAPPPSGASPLAARVLETDPDPARDGAGRAAPAAFVCALLLALAFAAADAA